MKQKSANSATLSRLPKYLAYLKSLPGEPDARISSVSLGAALGVNDILVRKDLAKICGKGSPKRGRLLADVICDIERYFLVNKPVNAVVIGCGHLGLALLECTAFANYGINILAAFDHAPSRTIKANIKPVLSLKQLKSYCLQNSVQMGILTTSEDNAQDICDLLIYCGIRAVWNFSPCNLTVPDHIHLKQENIPASAVSLCLALKKDASDETGMSKL